MLRAAFTLLLLASLAPPLAAQAPAIDQRWAVVPQIGFGTLGHRWEYATAEGDFRLGLGTSPMLGASIQYHPPGRFTVEALAGFLSSDYSLETVDPSGNTVEKITGAGAIQLYRVAAGAQFRVREGAPGYFAAGGGALLYRPTKRIIAGEAPLFDDREQWMPSGHLGLGLDVGGVANNVRLDARLYGSRPSQELVSRTTPSPDQSIDYKARLAFDFVVSFGYLVRF